MNPDIDIDPQDQYGDAMDYYEEYSEWLMANCSIANGDDLVRYLEDGDKFEQFLKERK